MYKLSGDLTLYIFKKIQSKIIFKFNVCVMYDLIFSIIYDNVFHILQFYRFEGDKKPIILIQMLVADHRKRCSSTRLRALNTFRSHSYERWLFEILVYHVMLRLIRTSTNKGL